MVMETPEKVSKDRILAEQLVATVLCADCMVDDAKYERLVEAVRHIVAMSVSAMLQETGAAEALLASAPHQRQPAQDKQRQRARLRDLGDTKRQVGGLD